MGGEGGLRMIRIEDSHTPFFFGKKSLTQLRGKPELTREDASGTVTVCVVALICILLMGFLASPFCPEWLYIRSAGAETVLYPNVNDFLSGRAEPDKDSFLECKFYPGDEMIPTGDAKDGYIEVIGGETGTVWVNEKYVISSKTGTVKSNGRVNVRSEPDSNSSHVKWVYDGDTIEIYTESSGWIKTDGGWINGNFVEAD
jgi:hypothetical protein